MATGDLTPTTCFSQWHTIRHAKRADRCPLCGQENSDPSRSGVVAGLCICEHALGAHVVGEKCWGWVPDEDHPGERRRCDCSIYTEAPQPLNERPVIVRDGEYIRVTISAKMICNVCEQKIREDGSQVNVRIVADEKGHGSVVIAHVPTCPPPMSKTMAAILYGD